MVHTGTQKESDCDKTAHATTQHRVEHICNYVVDG